MHVSLPRPIPGQRINDEVAAWMNGAVLPDGSQAAPPFPAMGDSNSVQWNRTFGKERVSDCEPWAVMRPACLCWLRLMGTIWQWMDGWTMMHKAGRSMLKGQCNVATLWFIIPPASVWFPLQTSGCT